MKHGMFKRLVLATALLVANLAFAKFLLQMIAEG